MSRPDASARPRLADAPARAFTAPLCGIDGSRKAEAAARQVAAIAGPGSKVTLLSIVYESGVGLAQTAGLSSARARDALAEAQRAVRNVGVKPATEVVEARGAAGALLERSSEHDLLAVGAPAGSRVEGAGIGDVASVIVHKAAVPVLVARPGPGLRSFPRHILVASDGSEGAMRAAHVAAVIAHRRRSRVTVLYVGRHGDLRHRRLPAKETTELMEATVIEPVIVIEDGDPADRIVEVARRDDASLVVVGSRGVGGIRALRSVSERVAHRAPCSVLVMRPAPGGRAIEVHEEAT